MKRTSFNANPRRRAAMRCIAAFASILCLLLGCTTSYHPMSGLQRPSPIDLTRPNLTNVPVQLTCVPSAVDDPSDARQLCERLGALLINQGATVLDDLQESEGTELDDYLELRLSSRYLFKREQSFWIRLATFELFNCIYFTCGWNIGINPWL